MPSTLPPSFNPPQSTIVLAIAPPKFPKTPVKSLTNPNNVVNISTAPFITL
nr:MAG TPA: hypothetical protein [Caudoviricetes sp.]